LTRRVVVTGVGLLSSVGIGAEETWRAIRSGTSGIDRITAFDPTGFNCQIAGEVKSFDPANYIEKKEIKKMGRFIQFAIAAADCALKSSGLKVSPEVAERVGVYIGSGIGGFEVIEREHKILLEKGPGRISPFFIPATIINLASGYVSIRAGAKGRNDLRRRGGRRHADERRRFCRDARSVAEEWRTAASVPAVGQRS
jgi:3-oxoacyl-[acyl-carrier-protein] synthase II